MLEVKHHASMATWSVFDEATLCIGYGNTEAEAMADYRDNCSEQLGRLVDLGCDRVAPRLWATVPVLRATLGIGA